MTTKIETGYGDLKSYLNFIFHKPITFCSSENNCRTLNYEPLNSPFSFDGIRVWDNYYETIVKMPSARYNLHLGSLGYDIKERDGVFNITLDRGQSVAVSRIRRLGGVYIPDFSEVLFIDRTSPERRNLRVPTNSFLQRHRH